MPLAVECDRFGDRTAIDARHHIRRMDVNARRDRASPKLVPHTMAESCQSRRPADGGYTLRMLAR